MISNSHTNNSDKAVSRTSPPLGVGFGVKHIHSCDINERLENFNNRISFLAIFFGLETALISGKTYSLLTLGEDPGCMRLSSKS